MSASLQKRQNCCVAAKCRDWPLAAFAAPQNLRRYRTNDGQRAARGPNLSAAFDLKRTSTAPVTSKVLQGISQSAFDVRSASPLRAARHIHGARILYSLEPLAGIKGSIRESGHRYNNENRANRAPYGERSPSALWRH